MTGKGGGTGSPVWFRCTRDRATRYHVKNYRVTLTGRTKPYYAHGSLGARSVHTSYEYVCKCGHVGWSNHIDLARQAGDDEAITHRGYTP